MKKKTSINIDENVWQKVREHCVKNRKDISEWLEELIKRELKIKSK